MAWEERGNVRYYYRKRREGGRVVSEYIGRGPVAELLAEIDERERQSRTDARRLAHARREAERDEEAALDALEAQLANLTQAALLAAGYHTHKRQWRKRRP